MGLFEFFFPEQAQAEHLRRIANSGSFNSNRERRRALTLDSRVRQLESDLGYAVLVLGSILERLNQKGLVTRDEVKAEMAALDALDGVRDGSLDIAILRGRTVAR